MCFTQNNSPLFFLVPSFLMLNTNCCTFICLWDHREMLSSLALARLQFLVAASSKTNLHSFFIVTKCKQISLHLIKPILKKGVKVFQFNSHLEWAWQPPKRVPIPISLIFSKDPAPLQEVGPLVTHSTFNESDCL